MSSVKDDEEFWYSTEKRSFSFDNIEVDQLFGVLKNDTEKLWAGMTNASTSEGHLKQFDEAQDLKPLLSILSDKTLSCILAADRQVQIASSENVDVQPEITLRKILLGQPYTLEPYRSFASKTNLLDAAILSGDGNAILIIILSFAKTLKRSLLQRLLTVRPEAVSVFVHYLSTRLQTNEVVDILTMLGRPLDAAMKHLHIIMKNTRDPSRLLQKLECCYKTQFSTLTECKEASYLWCYVKLLEWQNSVKSIGENAQLPENAPVLECLRYACKNHWNCPENSSMSANVLCQQQDISPRQYQKNALLVRASVGAWDDVDRLFPTKGWLKSKKLQTHLPVEEILTVLHNCQAPAGILEKYLKYVDDTETRLGLAMKLHCCRIAIDILVMQGSRSALLEYKEKLQSQSEEYFYAESALRLPSVKWKT